MVSGRSPLANNRAIKGRPRTEDRSELVLASFAGKLAALRYVDELTADEERDWADRMRFALGITTNRIVSLRVAGNDEPLSPVTPASRSVMTSP